VGPFVRNTRIVRDEADSILKQFHFQPSFTWSYDTFSIISNLRVELKTRPYNHTHRPKIEKFMNQDQWEENTLQEEEEHMLSTTTLHALVLQDKHGKRQREEPSSSACKEISAQEFIIQ